METTPTQKKRISLWVLYDFANSIAIAVFAVYFSEWLVVDRGVSDIWYNLIFVGSTLLLLFTGPVLGAIADKRGVQMPYLRVATTLQFIALVVGSLLAVTLPGTRGIVFAAAIAFLLGNYFYQLTFTFYNALLPDLGPPERQGRISGMGEAGNLVGQVAGLLLSLPVIAGTIYFFGHHGREQTFLPSAILFFLLALPMLVFFKDRNKPRPVTTDVKKEYRGFFSSLHSMFRLPGVGRYLVAYFFFNDAMITVVNNLTIYIERVFHVPDKTKSLLFAGILLMAAVGAFVGGQIADRIGLKRSIIILLACWTVFFPAFGSISDFSTFVVLSVAIGFLGGATWSISRAVMSYLAPVGRVNEGFGYFTLAERFSTFVGPLAWGGIILVFAHTGALRYHIAMSSMGVFMFIGLLIVLKIPSDRSAS